MLQMAVGLARQPFCLHWLVIVTIIL